MWSWLARILRFRAGCFCDGSDQCHIVNLLQKSGKTYSWRLNDPSRPGPASEPEPAPKLADSSGPHLLHEALRLCRKRKVTEPEYTCSDSLGQGTFASVMTARLKDGNLVALKKFKGKQDIAGQLEEIHCLQSVSSKFIMQLLDVTSGDSAGSLALGFPVAKCNLAQHLVKIGGFSSLQMLKRIAGHIASGRFFPFGQKGGCACVVDNCPFRLLHPTSPSQFLPTTLSFKCQFWLRSLVIGARIPCWVLNSQGSRFHEQTPPWQQRSVIWAALWLMRPGGKFFPQRMSAKRAFRK